MCTTDLCNDLEYDIHEERAKILFNRSSSASNFRNSDSNLGSSTTNSSSSIATATVSLIVEVAGGGFNTKTAVESVREESGGDDGEEEPHHGAIEEAGDDSAGRVPRQAGQGNNDVDQMEQPRLSYDYQTLSFALGLSWNTFCS